MIGRIFELWGNIPSWIKWPFIIIIGPNLTVMVIIFFFWIVPWYNKSMHATIMSYEEKRDIQMQAIVTDQKLQYEYVQGSLQRIEQHQAIMYSALLNNRHQP